MTLQEQTESFIKVFYPNYLPVRAMIDDSSHWYLIPEDKVNEFSDLLTRSEDDYDIQNEFIKKFSQYMTGGDINNTQLYIKA